MGLTILNTKLSSTLREARARKGLSQEMAAARLKLSLDELTYIELNPIRAPLRILSRVIEAYKSDDAAWLVQTASVYKYPTPNK